MRPLVALAVGFCTVQFLLPANSAFAQDAQDILRMMAETQADRWNSVNNYTITVAVEEAGGLQTTMYFQRMETDGQTTFQMILPGTYTREMHIKAGYPPPEDAAEGMARGYRMLGSASVGGFSLGQVSIPAGDGGTTLYDMSEFLDVTAEASRRAGDDSLYRANAASEVSDAAAFMRRARLVGRERVAARTVPETGEFQEVEAYHVVADDLDDVELQQPASGPTFRLIRTSLWVDAKEYVPLRLLVDIEIEKDGKRSSLTLEKLDLDYSEAGPLYVSRTRVSRMTGIMEGLSDRERKDLEKAQKELAKAKKQISEMPESQRAMVMKMMGGQMEKLEKMASRGSIESVTKVVNVAVNEGPPTPFGLGTLEVNGQNAQQALTMAGLGGSSGGSGAQLVISRGGPPSKAMIELTSGEPWPENGTIAINAAEGNISDGSTELRIEGASGTIRVLGHTSTRIHGTYSAHLAARTANDELVPISIEGVFDSGAPTGPRKAPRGSPIESLQELLGAVN